MPEVRHLNVKIYDSRKKEMQNADISPLLMWKRTLTERPSWKQMAKYSDTTKNYCAQWNSLEVVEEILYRNWTSVDGREKCRQLVVLFSLHREFVARIHGWLVDISESVVHKKGSKDVDIS